MCRYNKMANLFYRILKKIYVFIIEKLKAIRKLKMYFSSRWNFARREADLFEIDFINALLSVVHRISKSQVELN
jgi:hypothetical protein